MMISTESNSSKLYADANNNSDPFDTNRLVIKNFYKNSCVLVTGGTGFLGKVLIEKLLRTCEDIQSVYVLVRSKRGLSSEKRYERYKAAADTGEFFAMHEWRFETANMQELMSEISCAADGSDFNCDVRIMNWDSYIENYMFGIRKYVLKDGLESMVNARKALRRLFITKWLMHFGFIGIFLWLYWRLFS